MATMRVRFKLNPGREGIALGKLSQQALSIEGFLRSLGSDLGEKDEAGLWIAKDFKDGSFMGTIEYHHVVEAEKASNFNTAIHALTKYKETAKKPLLPSFVSAVTVSKFAAIRQGLDPDEPIGIAMFDEETGKQKRWGYVDRLQLELIGGSVETEVKYVGSVMGQTYEWNKGAIDPYIVIRELNTGELVKCIYSDDDYSQVARLFADKAAIVIVEGLAIYNRVSGKTEIAMAQSFDFAPPLRDEDFERFFGIAPDFTGNVPSEEFIRRSREDDD
jgi:hypothetical protein